MNSKKFISVYGAFYDAGSECLDYERYGIPKDINKTDSNIEKHITKLIKEGIYNLDAFAWKNGKLAWKDDSPRIPNNYFERGISGLGGYLRFKNGGNPVSIEEFDKIINEIGVEHKKYRYNDRKDRALFYEDVLNAVNLYNFGSVQLINVMFFLSRGAIPIYDYYAHVAIKALYMDINPRDVFMTSLPEKSASPKVEKSKNKNYYIAVNALEEYIWLLNRVFPEEIYASDGMFICKRQIARLG